MSAVHRRNFVTFGLEYALESWSCAHGISSVLLSIQSLLSTFPYHNEPGFEREHLPGDAERYNDCIRHETLRVGVCQQMEHPHQLDDFRGVADKMFMEQFDYYLQTCDLYKRLDTMPLHDPFLELRGIFNYADIQKRLQSIYSAVQQRLQAEEDSSNLSEDSDDD